MPVRVELQVGDPVVYTPDQLLFGEMEITHLRCSQGGRVLRVVCRVDPDRRGPPAYELFDPVEIEVVGKVA